MAPYHVDFLALAFSARPDVNAGIRIHVALPGDELVEVIKDISQALSQAELIGLLGYFDFTVKTLYPKEV